MVLLIVNVVRFLFFSMYLINISEILLWLVYGWIGVCKLFLKILEE